MEDKIKESKRKKKKKKNTNERKKERKNSLSTCHSRRPSWQAPGDAPRATPSASPLPIGTAEGAQNRLKRQGRSGDVRRPAVQKGWKVGRINEGKGKGDEEEEV